MSIEVKNLFKYYGEQAAVRDVTFSVAKGEIVGFLGPNGAGKSTTMKILTGFISASSGEVKVCGMPVDVDSLDTRRKIGYLPENNPLYLDMYVKEYLEFVGKIYHVKNLKARVIEMIKAVGLELEQDKKLGALSKGYRQRVGLAQALIHDPDVLILDEPTQGVDEMSRNAFLKFLEEIALAEGVKISTKQLARFEPVEFDPRVIDIIESIAKQQSNTVQRMPSGAGHDAQFASYMLPSTMIFVQSKDGLSHCEPEYSSPEHCTEGATVLLNAVLKADAD